MSKTLKEKTANSIIWNFIDKFGQQGVNLIVWIILARYFLTPSDYALVGMIIILNALGSVLIDSGFSNALIRKQDVSQTDLSSVFYFNIFISIVFYGLVFFIAPLFALYFDQPILTKLARVMALSIPITSLTLVQNAHLYKTMKFKHLACINSATFFCSGALSLFLAWKGLGVWVLVVQPLTCSIIRNICLWSFNVWRPSAVYSMDSIKNLWGYSSKLLLSSTIAVIFSNIYVFFIGKIYPLKDAGYYTQANKYSELPYLTIMSAIQTVIYPVMASIGAHDSELLKRTMRKTVRAASFMIFPVMLGLIATAEPLIHTLLDTKWLPLVPYFQILCVGYLFIGLTTSYNNILFVKGLSSTFLKFNLIYRTFILLSIVFTMHYGIVTMLVAWSIVAILYSLSLMIYVGKKISYTLVEQVKDMLPYFALALSMGAGVFLFTFLIENRAVVLIVQIISGATFYLGATYLLGSKVFREAIDMVKKKL
jgi:O-antigen/teichoic acid export membrane protein